MLIRSRIISPKKTFQSNLFFSGERPVQGTVFYNVVDIPYSVVMHGPTCGIFSNDLAYFLTLCDNISENNELMHRVIE